MMRSAGRRVALVLVALFLGIQSRGASVTIEWDPSPNSALSEYRIYRGLGPEALIATASVPASATKFTFTDLLAGQVCFFAVTALTKEGFESDFSNLIVYTVPLPLSSTLVASDASARTLEDSAVALSLKGANLLFGPLHYEIVTAPSHGQISGVAPALVYTPARNFFGTDLFTYRVSDGFFDSATATVSISVAPVNDPPTLDPIMDKVIAENGGPQTVALCGITSGADNEVQTLTVTAISSNPGLIPNPVVCYSTPDYAGSLQITPVQGMSGTVRITVAVRDGAASNNIVERTFTVTVNPAPHITDITQTASDARSVTLAWKTDRDAKCFVNYGLTTNFGLTSFATFGIAHSITLSNLTPAATYFVQVSARADGVSSQSEIWTVPADSKELFSFQASDGSAVYPFNIKTESTYRLWAHVKAPYGAGSFTLTVDDGSEMTVSFTNIEPAGDWISVASNVSGTNCLLLPFTRGVHTLMLGAGDPNVSLDTLMVVNDPDWRPPPTLSIREASQNSVTLAWKINALHFDYAVIEAATDGQNFYPEAVVTERESVGVIDNLGRKKTYSFRLAIGGAEPRDAYSNIVIR